MFRAKLTTWLVAQRMKGIDIPMIPPKPVDPSDFFRQIEEENPIPFSRRRENFFRFLESMCPSFDFLFRFSEDKKDRENLNRINAYIEARSMNSNELSGLCELLAKNGYIKYDNSAFSISLEQKGWEYLESISNRRAPSDNAFVAMWFNKSLDNVYSKHFQSALQTCGYAAPFRIDEHHYTGKVDDEIISKIKQASLVVVDLTCNINLRPDKIPGDGNIIEARGNVYFEAGFAMGLEIPIVWTCRQDCIDGVHFDTRQYPLILWYQEKDQFYVDDINGKKTLHDALVDRITAINKNRNIN